MKAAEGRLRKGLASLEVEELRELYRLLRRESAQEGLEKANLVTVIAALVEAKLVVE